MAKKSEIILNIIWIIIALSLFSIAIPYADMETLDPIGPHVFPQLMSILILICAAINLISIILTKETIIQKNKKVHIDTKNIVKLVLIISMGGLYILFMPWLGYLISTILLMFCLIVVQSGIKIWVNIYISISFSAILYLVFSMILNILLPHGFLKII